MNRYVWIILCSILLVSVGCHSACPVSTVPLYPADDGTLYRTIIKSTATVLKDGTIAGAGAFISQEGRFLTAAHVVHAPHDRIELLLHSGKVVRAEVIASDLGLDLAVLRAEDTDHRNCGEFLRLSDALPPPGSPIFMIGAPKQYIETLIPGRIARERIGFNFIGNLKSYVRSLIITADSAPGSSGGCWVNQRGQIVGVQSAYIVGKDLGSLGLGLISPVSSASPLIRHNEDHPATTLGGQLVSLRTQAYTYKIRFPPGSQGVAVHEVFEAGPLQRAGIPKDHMITHVDGQPVMDVDNLYALVRSGNPGDTMRLTVLSPDKHVITEYDVELDELIWE